MPAYNVSAIILRRTNFGETDRIVTMYSRERGRISAIAKGVRKAVSRLAGPTESLTYGRYQLGTGRKLDIVTQAEVRESFPHIHERLDRIAYASYVVELVDKMVEDDHEHPEVFDLMLSALYLLERPNDPGKIAHMFELQLMKLLGYEPALDMCVRCGRPMSASPHFSPSLGGAVCRECGRLPEDAIRVHPDALTTMSRLLQADAPEVERMQISKPVMDQISRSMRWYVCFRAEREIKCVEFIHALSMDENR